MIDINTYDSADAQAEALAHAVAQALETALAGKPAAGRVTLAVSGGKSPVTFFQHLARVALNWERVDLTLVDDRWLPDTHEDSNARMVRDTLLLHGAAAARFIPLVDASKTPEAAIAGLNAASAAGRPAIPDVAVLGMGEDGHTASIFADAPEWNDAITTTAPFVIVHPSQAPHARVSWSLTALRQVGSLFLQIGGAKKRAVLDAAAASPQRNAISQLAVDGGVTLNVYWYA